MSGEIQVQVRRLCKHNHIHAHSVLNAAGPSDAPGGATERWCAEGNLYIPTPAELIDLFSEILAGVHPRVEKDRVVEKAEQLVDGLRGLVA
jgi:hypothetical protein